MTVLKPCPCGKIPDNLLIYDNGTKWGYAFGDCCNTWGIEFRTVYKRIDSLECKKLAIEAWNLAERGIPQQSEQTDSTSRNLLALLEECYENGNAGEAQLYAWFSDQANIIEQAIEEARQESPNR